MGKYFPNRPEIMPDKDDMTKEDKIRWRKPRAYARSLFEYKHETHTTTK